MFRIFYGFALLFAAYPTVLVRAQSGSAAPTLVTFDLASAAEHDTVTLQPGTFQFRVISLVNNHNYVIGVSRGVEQIAPIPVPGGMGLVNCPKLSAAIKGLDIATTEAEMPTLVQQAQAAVDAERGDATCATLVSQANTLISHTQRTSDDVYVIKQGEYVTVDVSRVDNGKTTKHWQRRFTTGASGGWRATYGYAFPQLLRISHFKIRTDGRQFFAKQIGDTGSKYIITEQHRRHQFDAVPAIMFSYAPANEGKWTWSWTAGLAADITKPMMFVGPSLTYRSNLQFSTGIAFRQEKVPIGRYSVGDTVRTNLTTEQLQEDAFRARPLLSITLRFDKNPFKKASADAATAENPATKKPDEKPTAKPAAKPPKNE